MRPETRCADLVREVYVNAMDDTQKTALHHAARHSQSEILRYLLNAGAMSEARDHNGCTVVASASCRGPNFQGLDVRSGHWQRLRFAGLY